MYWKGCSIVWHYNGGLPTEKSNCINFRRDFRRSLISSQLWGSVLSSRFRFNCLTNTALRTAFCFWNPIVPLREKILFTTLMILIVKSFDVYVSLHISFKLYVCIFCSSSCGPNYITEPGASFETHWNVQGLASQLDYRYFTCSFEFSPSVASEFCNYRCKQRKLAIILIDYLGRDHSLQMTIYLATVAKDACCLSWRVSKLCIYTQLGDPANPKETRNEHQLKSPVIFNIIESRQVMRIKKIIN